MDTDDTDDEGTPQISLQEMLDDLHISDDMTGGGDMAAGGGNMAVGGSGEGGEDAMME